MHIYKKTRILIRISSIFAFFFPLLFWGLVIFALDAPYAAFATIIAAVIHEAGHKLAFYFCKKGASLPTPGFFGFRILCAERISYKNEIVCAAAGPLMNFVSALAALPLLVVCADAYASFAVISIATGLSNLLPIKGYDGYKIITTLAASFGSELLLRAAEAFSFFMMCAATFFSLYLIEKAGEGYWIFFVFFFSLLSEASKSHAQRQKHE